MKTKLLTPLSGEARSKLAQLAPIFGGQDKALAHAIDMLYDAEIDNPLLATPPVPMTISLGNGRSAIIDADDYDYIMATGSWRLINPGGGNTLYAGSTINGKTVLMHALILGYPKGMVGDHINGDGLDNRRANLRVCTPSQNLHNSWPKRDKKYKGVWKRAGYDLWYAVVDRKRIGAFRSEEEAARAYNKEALKQRGEYAKLNEVE